MKVRISQKSVRLIMICLVVGYGGLASAGDWQNVFAYNVCMAAKEACDTTGCDPLLQRYCNAAPGVYPTRADFDEPAFDALVIDPASDSDWYPQGSGGFQMYPVWKCDDGNQLDGNGLCPTGDPEPIRCTDGTRPVFHAAPSTAGFTNRHGEGGALKWIIKLHGGNEGCGVGTATKNYCTSDEVSKIPSKWKHYSTAGGPGENSQAQSFESKAYGTTDPDYNFATWNRVFLDKCVGDGNLGTATHVDGEITENGVTADKVYFHGYRIVRAMVKQLASTSGAGLDSAEYIAFVTQSAGSKFATHYMDDLVNLTQTLAPNTGKISWLKSSWLLPEAETAYAAVHGGTYPGHTSTDYNSIDVPFGDPAHDDATTSPGAPCGDPALGDGDYPAWLKNDWLADSNGNCLRDDAVSPTTDTPYRTSIDATDKAAQFAMWGASIDSSCAAFHGSAGSDSWPCYSESHLQIYHIETPTFIAVQNDPKLRAIGLNPGLVDISEAEHTPALSLETYRDRSVMLLEKIGQENGSNVAFHYYGSNDHAAFGSKAKMTREIEADDGVTYQLQDMVWRFATHGSQTFHCAHGHDDFNAENAYAQAFHGDTSVGSDSCEEASPPIAGYEKKTNFPWGTGGSPSLGCAYPFRWSSAATCPGRAVGADWICSAPGGDHTTDSSIGSCDGPALITP